MNGLDIVFAVILGFTLLRGVFRGAVKEVASLLGLGAGFFLASTYAQEVSVHLGQVIEQPQVAVGVSYLLIFFSAFIVVVFIGLALRKFLHAVMLGWADRLGGAALGLGKGVLISCLVLFVITLFVSPQTRWVAGSRLSPYLNLLTQRMILLVPEGMKDTFASKSRELHDVWRASPLYELKHRADPGVNES